MKPYEPHDKSCSGKCCQYATRLERGNYVRRKTRRQYERDMGIATPRPLAPIIEKALSENVPASRNYKGVRDVRDTDMRAAFDRAVRGAK